MAERETGKGIGLPRGDLVAGRALWRLGMLSSETGGNYDGGEGVCRGGERIWDGWPVVWETLIEEL